MWVMRKATALAALAALFACQPSTTGERGSKSPAPSASVTPTPTASAKQPRVLLFSKTAGFRHDSIPTAVAAITASLATKNIAAEATEDASAFNGDNLSRFAAVVFLNTTGDVLDEAQQSAFEAFIRSGNGYAGIHSASDTEYEWPFYGRLVGAYFKDHPPGQRKGTLVIADPKHPLTQTGAEKITVTDELYNFKRSPRGEVRILASVDESSYDGGNMGADHPMIWCSRVEGGRAWYIAMGHLQAMYSDPSFMLLVRSGIEFASGALDADCTPN